MQDIANTAADALLKKPGRQLISLGATDSSTAAPSLYPSLHVGTWGPPKSRKSSFALRARTHMISLPGQSIPGETKFDPPTYEPGELLIPSKPLTIAYANFDRSAHTVYKDITLGANIIEERLYEMEDGTPLALGGPTDYQRLTDRFLTFVEDMMKMDEPPHLIFVDGGTILWENVRGVLLDTVAPGGKTPEGDPRHLPRQYGPSNKYMREQIMKRLYNMQLHTVISRESSERWAGQNEPLKDPNEPGGVALRADGWNKTGHYVDVDLQMRMITNPGQAEIPTAVCHLSIVPGMIGTTIRNPTFASVYELVTRMPLLLPEDRETYRLARAEHGKLIHTAV